MASRLSKKKSNSKSKKNIKARKLSKRQNKSRKFRVMKGGAGMPGMPGMPSWSPPMEPPMEPPIGQPIGQPMGQPIGIFNVQDLSSNIMWHVPVKRDISPYFMFNNLQMGYNPNIGLWQSKITESNTYSVFYFNIFTQKDAVINTDNIYYLPFNEYYEYYPLYDLWINDIEQCVFHSYTGTFGSFINMMSGDAFMFEGRNQYEPLPEDFLVPNPKKTIMRKTKKNDTLLIETLQKTRNSENYEIIRKFQDAKKALTEARIDVNFLRLNKELTTCINSDLPNDSPIDFLRLLEQPIPDTIQDVKFDFEGLDTNLAKDLNVIKNFMKNIDSAEKDLNSKRLELYKIYEQIPDRSVFIPKPKGRNEEYYVFRTSMINLNLNRIKDCRMKPSSNATSVTTKPDENILSKTNLKILMGLLETLNTKDPRLSLVSLSLVSLSITKSKEFFNSKYTIPETMKPETMTELNSLIDNYITKLESLKPLNEKLEHLSFESNALKQFLLTYQKKQSK